MRDPHNPYRPYTQQAGNHDAEYTRTHQRRQQEGWDLVNQYSGANAGGRHAPVASGAGGRLSGILVGIGALVGVSWLIEWTGDPYVAFGALGVAVLALAALMWAVRRFFDTRFGQFVATLLKTVSLAGLGAGMLWLVHDSAGMQGLYGSESWW